MPQVEEEITFVFEGENKNEIKITLEKDEEYGTVTINMKVNNTVLGTSYKFLPSKCTCIKDGFSCASTEPTDISRAIKEIVDEIASKKYFQAIDKIKYRGSNKIVLKQDLSITFDNIEISNY